MIAVVYPVQGQDELLSTGSLSHVDYAVISGSLCELVWSAPLLSGDQSTGEQLLEHAGTVTGTELLERLVTPL